MSGLLVVALLASVAAAAPAPHGPKGYTPPVKPNGRNYQVSYGPRPFYIVNNMTDSPLKRKLESCANGPFSISEWSIGHRGGGTLQFPEETEENTLAGARMGSGVLECDVAFTSDLELVCRHSQCDLHTTTDILLRPELAAKCTQPFTPANGTSPASALCCTSDITLAEYGTLCGKVDGSNSSARTPQAYQRGGPTWRTDLYNTCGKVLSLNEHIDLVNSIPGFRNYTPELKTPPAQVPMPFNGNYTQQQYARDMIEAFISKGIDYHRVWPQSFLPDDVFQWIEEYPDTFGRQAVYLDDQGDDPANLPTAAARLPALRARGLNYLAPPIPYLLTIGNSTKNSGLVPSDYARAAKAADLDIISWTFERSGPLQNVNASADFYFQTFSEAISFDGQNYEVLDVLYKDVGIIGLFTDWSETVGYFANCLKIPGPSVAAQRRERLGLYDRK
ncbi:glycerophosphoryl diester phosphodiesterase [Elsinoe ampelina]|uniref:glycerophosphodiester phosphodiesterase n=1 Tax=Elsinoe ampelina TaxID=302913 RepID=A0A6A6G0V6_9PEZI|nr:glycerophosphoryl diester phosphodiesterase [Elsinoe ampelina]